MSLPKYSELNSLLTIGDIEKEIFVSQKFLFDLKMKKSTNQSLKPHLFTHTKRRISQLQMKKSLLLKTMN
jgi:ribosomal protein L29